MAAPQCAPGVAQAWTLTAKCSDPTPNACGTGSDVAYGTATSGVANCHISVDETGAVDDLSKCLEYTATGYNCDCANADVAPYIGVTNATQDKLRVRNVDGTGPGDQTLCALGPTESCHLNVDFDVTTTGGGTGPFSVNWGDDSWKTAQGYTYNITDTAGTLAFQQTCTTATAATCGKKKTCQAGLCV
jgi:hypothetical protein